MQATPRNTRGRSAHWKKNRIDTALICLYAQRTNASRQYLFLFLSLVCSTQFRRLCRDLRNRAESAQFVFPFVQRVSGKIYAHLFIQHAFHTHIYDPLPSPTIDVVLVTISSILHSQKYNSHVSRILIKYYLI